MNMRDFPPGSPATFRGMQIRVDDELMSEWYEDWSGVRSPGRAARRRKRGFRQRIVLRKRPKQEFMKFENTIIMHSEMLKILKKKMAENDET